MKKFPTVAILAGIVAALLLTGATGGRAQSESYTIPVKWQLYSVGSHKAAFLMPKPPVADLGGDFCRGEKTLTYAAYADGVVYLVRITAKTDPPAHCSEKRTFSARNFRDRVEELRREFPLRENAAAAAEKSDELKLTGTNRMIRLVNDRDNYRWFELGAYGADESRKEVIEFLTSLKTDRATNGVEIGSGATRTLGDEPVAAAKSDTSAGSGAGSGSGGGSAGGTQSSAENIKSEPLTLIHKPQPRYTDAARQNGTQGEVVLKTTFLAGGGIGSITLVSGLPDGLTEQAIAAARRIVFIPTARNGVRYSVTKTIVYNFTIY